MSQLRAVRIHPSLLAILKRHLFERSVRADLHRGQVPAGVRDHVGVEVANLERHIGLIPAGDLPGWCGVVLAPRGVELLGGGTRLFEVEARRLGYREEPDLRVVHVEVVDGLGWGLVRVCGGVAFPVPAVPAVASVGVKIEIWDLYAVAEFLDQVQRVVDWVAKVLTGP